MVSRYVLNQIAAEFECINYAGIDSSRCGCIMRTTHDLPCSCELDRYVVDSIPLGIIHMFWHRMCGGQAFMVDLGMTFVDD